MPCEDKDLKFDYLVLEHYDLKAVLLCTDGLTSMLEDVEIERILKQIMSTQEKVNLLIDLANEQGGNDNISVALCESMEGSCSI